MRAKDYPKVDIVNYNGFVIGTRPMTKEERESHDYQAKIAEAVVSVGMVRVPLVDADGFANEIQVPEGVLAAAHTLLDWAAKNNIQGPWSIHGIGDVQAARRDALKKAQDAIAWLRG